jgi:hypothetical protein
MKFWSAGFASMTFHGSKLSPDEPEFQFLLPEYI